MHFNVELLNLKLKTPFRIAHGTSTERQNILVHLGDSVGEGAIMPHVGYSQRELVAYLQTPKSTPILIDHFITGVS